MTAIGGKGRGCAAVALAGCVLAACGGDGGGEWPQFRGPGGLGISSQENLPTTWSAGSENIRWESEIPGLGNSSPIVWGDRVYLTTAYEDAAEGAPAMLHRAVVAVDFATGELAWQTSVGALPAEKKHFLSSHAAPTPVTDGRRVFAYFGSLLAALDGEGRVLWKVEVDTDYTRYSRYGAASSPVLAAGSVIVAQDKESADEDVGWLAAFDPETGERRWRTEWNDTCCSYATPLVVRRGGEEELIFVHSGAVAGYDPKTGKELWRQLCHALQPVPSPVVGGDLLALTGGEQRQKSITVLRLSGTGAETEAEVLWEDRRQVSKISSPVLYQGTLYVITGNGVMSSYDAATGESRGLERLDRHGKYYPSLVAGDGKIYALSYFGKTLVIEAGAGLKVISENTLGEVDVESEEGNGASPAIAGGSILIRTRDRLYRIDRESDPSG